MKVTANCSFSGAICMAAGETRNIPDSALLQSLITAGYVTATEGAGSGGTDAGIFNVSFSQDASENWIADKTIEEIIAARSANQFVTCTIEIAQGIFGFGILASEASAEGGISFSASIPFESQITAFCMRGYESGEANVWEPIIGYTAPSFDGDSEDDVGKRVEIVADGDGGAKIEWVSAT